MDVPDRIIGDEVKLWRFRAEVLYPREAALYRYRNPVPVTAGNRIVGFASLMANVSGSFTSSAYLVRAFLADVAVDYSLPERLDVENGKKLWVLPQVRVTVGVPVAPQGTESWEVGLHASDGSDDRTIEIIALQIRDDCTDSSQAAIGEPLLVG